MRLKIFACLPAVFLASLASAQAGPADLHALIAQHAAANAVPESLVHRIVRRESNYNPRAVGRGGALGLMQIKYATARGLGYAGSPSGLLDANTNLTYAVRYLGNAYRVARGNHDRSVALYAGGYYYAAKRQGMIAVIAQHRSGGRPAARTMPARVQEVDATASIAPAAYGQIRPEGSGAR
jgi:soluble lytic murein transglycosylase-like protein